MPPKKGKEKQAAIIIDGIDTSLFSREKLEQFTIKVKEELDREREERNYFQLERDKIRTFWNITLEELDEAKARLKNIERASEVSREETDKILVFERQKTKFLKYEQLEDLKALKAENVVELEVVKAEHEAHEIELLDEKRTTKQKMLEKLQVEADELKRTKEKHAELLVKAIAGYDVQKKEVEDRTVKKLAETKVELEVRQRTELAEVAQRKNKQLSLLIEQHDKTYTELRSYYNDITLNNLGLIASIKLKTEDMEVAKKKADKIYREAVAEAKKLREPLELAILDNNELRRQMANYDRDKASLKAKKILLIKLEKQNNHLKWEYESLQAHFDKILPERNGIRERFTRAIQNVKEKLSGDSAKLEAKLYSLQDRETTMPVEIQEVFKMKDTQVEDLRYQAALLSKAHDDLLATYEAKFLELGVPSGELGLQPLRAVAVAGMIPVIGQGPAHLVTKDQ